MYGVTTSLPGVKYEQFGKQVLVTQLRFGTLKAIFEVDTNVQRQLDPNRRRQIREFIKESLENDVPVIFSPFVLSSRGAIQEHEGDFVMTPGASLFVLDGQHRSAAMEAALTNFNGLREVAEENGEYEEAERYRNLARQIENLPIALQIYLDLETIEERQLFTDYNTARKEVHLGLVARYDQRDEYTVLAREVAQELQKLMDIEMEKSRLTMSNTSVTSLMLVKRCMHTMFEGKLGEKLGKPSFHNCEEEKAKEYAMKFFKQWLRIFPKQMGNRKKFVSGYSGIQLALAYAVYQLTAEDGYSLDEAIDQLLVLKRGTSWKHTDPLFSHLYSKEKNMITLHSTTTAIKQTTDRLMEIIHG